MQNKDQQYDETMSLWFHCLSKMKFIINVSFISAQCKIWGGSLKQRGKRKRVSELTSVSTDFFYFTQFLTPKGSRTDAEIYIVQIYNKLLPWWKLGFTVTGDLLIAFSDLIYFSEWDFFKINKSNISMKQFVVCEFVKILIIIHEKTLSHLSKFVKNVGYSVNFNNAGPLYYMLI